MRRESQIQPPKFPKTTFGTQIVIDSREAMISYIVWLIVRCVYEITRVVAYAWMLVELSDNLESTFGNILGNGLSGIVEGIVT